MPRPDTRLSAQLADVLRKCTPAPHRRPRLQLAPRGWSCRCGAQAAVILDGEDQAACCSCALDEVSIDELYAVTKGYDENGDALGAALDGFSRFVSDAHDSAEHERIATLADAVEDRGAGIIRGESDSTICEVVSELRRRGRHLFASHAASLRWAADAPASESGRAV